MKFFTLIATFIMAVPAVADVVLFTDRPTARMQKVADLYAQNGGDKIQINELKYADMLTKLQAGEAADVIFVKDGVLLQDLKSKGLFAPLNSPFVDANVEGNLKDSDGTWTFITYRARTLVYDSNIDVSAINTYADLADPQWAGTLCLRTSQADYNRALVSGLIASYGSEKAKDIVNGWAANRAQPSFKDDNAVINAVAQGGCAFGLVNSYYLGMALNLLPNLPVSIKFLKMENGGVHANGTGAGVYANSQQKEKAQKFIEFMLSDEVQLFLTGEHFDFPAKTGLAPQTVVKDFGAFAVDPTNWSVLGTKVPEANQLMLDAQWE